MPRRDSLLTSFLLRALMLNTYLNLKWYQESQNIFQLWLHRKPRRGRRVQEHHSLENFDLIFKDWDSMKKHVYDPSRSKNRLLVCLKNSAYLKKLSSSSYSVIYQFCTAEEIIDNKKRKKQAKMMPFMEQHIEIMDGKTIYENNLSELDTEDINTRCSTPLLSGSEENDFSYPCFATDYLGTFEHTEDSIRKGFFLEDNIPNLTENYCGDHNYHIVDSLEVLDFEIFCSLNGISSFSL